MSELLTELRTRMEHSVAALVKELSGLRTGRASVELLDSVVVESYGSTVPLNQVGSVSVPESRLLAVQVWDKGLVKTVEKAIRDAGLGLNPSADGQVIRVPLPELTQERRSELVKIAGKYAEEGRVSIRTVRRAGLDTLKGLLKSKDISEDEEERIAKQIQDLTDEFVKKIDAAFVRKEKDIMQL